MSNINYSKNIRDRMGRARANRTEVTLQNELNQLTAMVSGIYAAELEGLTVEVSGAEVPLSPEFQSTTRFYDCAIGSGTTTVSIAAVAALSGTMSGTGTFSGLSGTTIKKLSVFNNFAPDGEYRVRLFQE